jgi:hypothetical protein
MPDMDKSADLMLRITPEMLEMLKIEAEKIDASVAFVVRAMLKDSLAARGHYATTESERANVRAASEQRAARQPGSQANRRSK